MNFIFFLCLLAVSTTFVAADDSMSWWPDDMQLHRVKSKVAKRSIDAELDRIMKKHEAKKEAIRGGWEVDTWVLLPACLLMFATGAVYAYRRPLRKGEPDAQELIMV